MANRPSAPGLVFVALVAASGCDPSFTPAEPVIGAITYEWQAEIPAEGLHAPGLPLEVPAGAVPAGTTLTVRVVSGVSKANPTGWRIPQFAGSVIQILPPAVIFARPLLWTTVGSTGLAPSVEHMFRADYGDAAWTWSSDVQASVAPGGGLVTFALDRPGLWIQGDAQAPVVAGSYRLSSLSCSSGASATPSGVYLVVAGDHYALTSAIAPGCHDEGTLAVSSGFYALTTGTRSVGFGASAGGTQLRLKTDGDFQGVCGSQSSLIMLFDFKGCLVDADCGAGGVCDGQLCGPAATTSATSCLADVVGVSPTDVGGGK